MSDGTHMPDRATPAPSGAPPSSEVAERSEVEPGASATPPEPASEPVAETSITAPVVEPEAEAPIATPPVAARITEPPSAEAAAAAEPPSSEAEAAEPPAAEPPPAGVEATEPPRSRRGLRRIPKVVIVVVAIVIASVALGAAAVAAATVYAQYGAVKNEPNSVAWRSLTPQFAGAAACTSCHEPQATVQDASAHVSVSCENCHGPAAAHAASEEAAEEVVMRPPHGDLCVRCHGTAPGRPADFPQVDPARHYSGGECLRCHDPHSIVAIRPPVVTHPLANLPVCTTCHAPDGLKEIPVGHELVPDATCLACHGPRASGGR